MSIAVFPGSFDPFTKGHEAVVRRGALIFDQLIIAVGTNTSKQHYFSQEQRLKMIESVFADEPKVSVRAFSGLTVDFCREVGAHHILRGLRDEKDFGYEKNIAVMNRDLDKGIDTVFLVTDPAYSSISSSILREIAKNKGDIRPFLPNGMDIEV